MESRTLLDWLVQKYPSSKRQTLKRMVETGRVWVNGKRAIKLKQGVSPQDKIDVLDRPTSAVNERAGSSLSIVYEDDDIIVVEKPAGLLTSTIPREKRPTLLANVRQYVARHGPKHTVGLIHRLDRDASGLLIFSKNDAAYESLKSQFFHHTVEREYHAVVHGVPRPPAARLQTHLVERTDGTVHSTRQVGKGQIAVSRYVLLKTERKLSLVRVMLETGRKHQIRVHMAGNGTPVVGDKVYGPASNAARLMLAATRLTIVHPRTGREMAFTCPIPSDFPVKAD